MLALLLVAVFSFAAVGATAVASATDASTAAKKKSKKCKKGYKKVGKKCKKKKAAAKTSETVASVKLTAIDYSAYGDEISGTITLKKPVTSIEIKTTRTRGVLQPRSSTTTLTSDGVALSIDFKIRGPKGPPSERSRAPVTYFVEADGVKSNTL
jgi:hypothetical protein